MARQEARDQEGSKLTLSFFFLGVLKFAFRALVLVRWALYCLSHDSSLFCFSYFSDWVLCFCPGPTSDPSLPTYTSHMAGIIAMHHHAQPQLLKGPYLPWRSMGGNIRTWLLKDTLNLQGFAKSGLLKIWILY
jgi:hypothetical protein